jgi:hypothetical protein
MKSVPFTIFIFLASSFSSAQEPIKKNEAIIVSQKNLSENCIGLYKSIANSTFPASVAAQHTVIRQGSCSVTVSFSLLTSGVVEDVEVSDLEERCKPFTRSSIEAVRKSLFHWPEINMHCNYTYTYELQQIN